MLYVRSWKHSYYCSVKISWQWQSSTTRFIKSAIHDVRRWSHLDWELGNFLTVPNEHLQAFIFSFIHSTNIYSVPGGRKIPSRAQIIPKNAMSRPILPIVQYVEKSTPWMGRSEKHTQGGRKGSKEKQTEEKKVLTCFKPLYWFQNLGPKDPKSMISLGLKLNCCSVLTETF